MNPFVDPKKRSISLPSGCKDLVDVLRRSDRREDSLLWRLDRKNDSRVRRFIHVVLFQAQHDYATELIIGSASASGDTPIRYKISGVWYDMEPLPSHIRPVVVAELARMAKLPLGQFPCEGVLESTFSGVQLKWTIKMTSVDEECKLMRVHD